MFQALPSSVKIALGVTRYSIPALVLIDVESVALEISSTDVMVAEGLPRSSYASYMTIAVQVRKRGNSRTIARSPKKCRLNTATEAATAFVKDEDTLNVTEAAE